MKKIFYLHGLDGTLSKEKREVLEKFAEVWGDDINYNKPHILKQLLQEAKYFKADYIIGSSMGGYIGFLISKIMDLPCLLFNPALPYRTMQPDIDGVEIPDKKTTETKIILGRKDEVIKFEDNKKYIIENLQQAKPRIIEVAFLEHSIDYDTFRRAINLLLKE